MVEIIAEIGWNHGGDRNLLKEMIHAAAESGATYAKFQNWSVAQLKDGPWTTDGRKEIYLKAEMTESLSYLARFFCSKYNIKYLTSIFSAHQASFVRGLSSCIKIPSTEIRNEELLKAALIFDKIYLSTGTCYKQELQNAYNILQNKDLTLMHCVSKYPCEPSSANLPRLNYLKNTYPNNKIGISCHGAGLFDALVSLEYGVQTIEKHFTIDRSLPGRDNALAILPNELRMLADYIKTREELNIHHTDDYMPCEEEARNIYAGRWDG